MEATCLTICQEGQQHDAQIAVLSLTHTAKYLFFSSEKGCLDHDSGFQTRQICLRMQELTDSSAFWEKDND